jgi:hypothetical protein
MLAVNRNQPERKDIVYYARRMVERLVVEGHLIRDYRKNVAHLSRAILKSSSGEDVDNRLQEIFDRVRSSGLGELADEMMLLLGRKMAMDRQLALDQIGNLNNGNDPAVEEDHCDRAEAVEIPVSVPPPKKRRKFGDFDVPERQQLGAAKSTVAKLHIVRSVFEQSANVPRSEFSSSFKPCFHSVIDPIMKCLTDHCGDSDEEFVRRWGEKMSHSDWGRKVCPGKEPKDGGQCAFVAFVQ